MTNNVYANMADEINERAARRAARDYDGPCIGRDPSCPCNDGDACHYKDTPRTKAWPLSYEQKWDTLWRAADEAILERHGNKPMKNTILDPGGKQIYARDTITLRKHDNFLAIWRSVEKEDPEEGARWTEQQLVEVFSDYETSDAIEAAVVLASSAHPSASQE